MRKINKVFINAPIFDILNNNEQTFASLSTEIRTHNIEAVAPSLNMRASTIESYKDFAMKQLTRALLACDIMVTHGDWHEFKECKTLNLIARELNIPVIHHVRLNEVLTASKILPEND